MVWLIVAAILAALLAGLCVTGEVALARASRAGSQELAGSRRPSTRLEAVLLDSQRYIAALLFGRLACETAATVLVTVVLVDWLGTTWRAYVIAAAIVIAGGYVVVGVGPRALGASHAERVARAAAALLQPVAWLLAPVTWLATVVATAVTPGHRARDAPLASEAELRGLVDLLEQRRVIQPGERKMIHSVFELGDTLVREVMVPRTDMVFIERDKTLRQALSLALRSGFSRIPVVGENEDDVVGIAYLKDIVARGMEHQDGDSVEKVESIMRPATYVPDSKPIDELLREMQARQTHVAIVIDEYGGTAGLATIEDILEEIVGEIADEYDQEQPTVEWLAPDQARVTSRLSVTDLADLFGVDIEAEDVETVGGLLAQALGRVPIAGSTAVVAGLRLTAENLVGRRNRIRSVLVERVDAAAAGDQQDRDQGDDAGEAERAGAGWPAAAEHAGADGAYAAVAAPDEPGREEPGRAEAVPEGAGRDEAGPDEGARSGPALPPATPR